MQARAFEVNEGQLRTLHEWANSGDARLVQRARVVLMSNEGVTAERVSEQLGVARVTVYKWRKRFRALGLHGLYDLPRSGQPRKLAKSTRDDLVLRTVFEIPPRGVRWSVRQLARDAGITEHQVRRIWADHGLQPHKRYGFPSVSERHFSDVQLCGLILAPPHNACVLAVRSRADEAGPREVSIGPRPGRRLRRSVRDLRHGEDSMFRALERLGATSRLDTEDSDRLETLVHALEQLPTARPDYELHVVFSSEATLDAVRDLVAQGRCSGLHLQALPLTCAWAETLEQVLSDANRQGAGGPWTEEIQSLRTALAEHSRSNEAADAEEPSFFAWSRAPRPWSQPMARSA